MVVWSRAQQHASRIQVDLLALARECPELGACRLAMTTGEPLNVTADEVLQFWRDAGRKRWFGHDETFDDMCETCFDDAYEQAAQGKLAHWMSDADSALALVILLDQIPRNMFRGTRKAYSTDPMAREYAETAIERAYDHMVESDLRMFFYMPFEHSEDAQDQQRSVELQQTLDAPDADKWARHHQRIIERFGRFPHRNAILDRTSSAEEQAWLDRGGFKG